MIALNVAAPTKLAMLFGAQMRARGRGRILNVGSTAGMAPYCATKAYVNSFTLALAAELKPHGVAVACLAPGVTQTRFAEDGGILGFGGPSRLKALFAAGKAARWPTWRATATGGCRAAGTSC